MEGEEVSTVTTRSLSLCDLLWVLYFCVPSFVDYRKRLCLQMLLLRTRKLSREVSCVHAYDRLRALPVNGIPPAGRVPSTPRGLWQGELVVKGWPSLIRSRPRLSCGVPRAG